MLLLQSFDMDLLQPAAEAFLALICCHQVIKLSTIILLQYLNHPCTVLDLDHHDFGLIIVRVVLTNTEKIFCFHFAL